MAQEQIERATRKKWNWRIWIGLLVAVLAFLSYLLVFYQYPITRNVPWANYLLFGISGILLIAGLRRAYGQPQLYRGKIVGTLVALVSAGILGLFCYFILYASKQIPRSAGAPQIGQRAPEFSMVDSTGKTHTLSSLLTEPMPRHGASAAAPRAVLLVFYRGYW